jgi:hypothetical protein
MSDAAPSVSVRVDGEGGGVPETPQKCEESRACPPWCRRDHRPGDRADDRLHQSHPAFVAVVHGDPRFARDEVARADSVVLRLVQRADSSGVWLEASSEEGPSLHLLVSAESAGRLAAAILTLLKVL